MPRPGQEETPGRACRDLSERRRLSTKSRSDSGAQDHRGYLLEEGGRRRQWCVASRRGGEITGGRWRSNWEKGNGVWCGFCPWAGLGPFLFVGFQPNCLLRPV